MSKENSTGLDSSLCFISIDFDFDNMTNVPVTVTPIWTAFAVVNDLEGDGLGKGTHISLFFVIMRGENDALLKWPFKQKVTLMLLDQDSEEHVIDAFRPDPTSSSFQRPKGAMNVASGCPMFCPHSELQRHAYIRDDVMFIKVIVDRPDWK